MANNQDDQNFSFQLMAAAANENSVKDTPPTATLARLRELIDEDTRQRYESEVAALSERLATMKGLDEAYRRRYGQAMKELEAHEQTFPALDEIDGWSAEAARLGHLAETCLDLGNRAQAKITQLRKQISMLAEQQSQRYIEQLLEEKWQLQADLEGSNWSMPGIRGKQRRLKEINDFFVAARVGLL